MKFLNIGSQHHCPKSPLHPGGENEILMTSTNTSLRQTKFPRSGYWILHRVLLIGLLFIVGSCAYYNTLFNARRSYKEGMEVLRENPNAQRIPQGAKRYFKTTIEKCWKLIELYTDKSKYADDALLLIAKSEFHLEKYAPAVLHLNQFLQKYPKSDLVPEARLWLGKALLREKKIDKANEQFLMVINTAKEPQIRSQASFELGLYAFENERYPEAIKYLQKALKEKLEDQYKALVLYYLGESYFIQKDYKAAIKNFKKAIKFSPTLDIDYKSRLHLGEAYSLTGKYEEAYHIFRKMLTAPRFKDFFSYIKTALGENYERENRLDEAVMTYREVVHSRKPNAGTAKAAFNLGHLYETVYQNIDSAVVYYGKVEKIYSRFDSVEVARNKTRFLGEFKEIRDLIKRDERLVYRLTHEPAFRDSLYKAQYEDSLRKAMSDEEDSLNTLDSLRQAALPTDSLKQAFQDSLTKARADTSDSLSATPADTVSEEDLLSFRKRALEEETPKQNAKKPGIPLPSQGSNAKPKKLEKRKLPEIEFDLMNNRYHLAEFYLLKEENYDSAAHYYHRFLETYEDSILTPKALYSLIYIYTQPGHENPQLVDSLEKVLIREYPNSVFTKEILKSKGLYKEETEITPQEAAKKIFLKAEKLYFSGDYKRALRLYKQIANIDSSWEICAKAQYAVAWIYENDLALNDSALAAYRAIVEHYPTARSFVQAARKKITPPVEAPGAPVPGDSTRIAAPTDTSRFHQPGQTLPGNEERNLKSEDILAEKIRWRRLREHSF